jgi:uncharacterized protein (DUF58 family)
MEAPRDQELAELLQEVRRIEVQSKRLVSDVMGGGYRSVFRGSGLEFDEVREYEVGDDPRTVDWNVTARAGRPFVKKFVDERELTAVFLLDLSASMNTGAGSWSARQMAARICACLALAAVKNSDKVGLIAFDRSVQKYVPPRKGTRHAMSIVRDCLALPAEQPGTDLSSALDLASRVLHRRTTLFLLSDFFDHNWHDALALCARRHDLIAVRLQVPELAMPPTGLARLRDPETGHSMIVDWNHRKARQAYTARVAAWQTKTAHQLRRAKVDLMDVPVPWTADPNAVARPILKFFRMRELRGAKR